MPGVKTAKRKAAEALCKRFPEAPTLSLARRLYRERPAEFRDIEGARGMIREVRAQKAQRGERRPHILAHWARLASFLSYRHRRPSPGFRLSLQIPVALGSFRISTFPSIRKQRWLRLWNG